MDARRSIATYSVVVAHTELSFGDQFIDEASLCPAEYAHA